MLAALFLALSLHLAKPWSLVAVYETPDKQTYSELARFETQEECDKAAGAITLPLNEELENLDYTICLVRGWNA